MRSMSINELQEVNGGTKYRCPLCGYTDTSFWKVAAHIAAEIALSAWPGPILPIIL